ncbi:acyl-CoA thioesterase [Fangia hongkongensis]|uniref:acyl-CoA thioesterase n=1 Tax=Fangia hongkongensis TaxID=270495 RepID=UPI00036F8F83|nr:hotdog domain-containing protein [Fangia hongkongensis]MBK2125824.1 acyl-CoA thioesterase [Fangia hongkongensis]
MVRGKIFATEDQEKYGVLVSRQIPMPKDCNHRGIIFGGWLLAEVDLSVSLVAIDACQGPVVTASVDAFSFLKPISVRQMVDVYAKVVKVGRTSITTDVFVFTKDIVSGQVELVATSSMRFVHVDAAGNPRPIDYNDCSK